MPGGGEGVEARSFLHHCSCVLVCVQTNRCSEEKLESKDGSREVTRAAAKLEAEMCTRLLPRAKLQSSLLRQQRVLAKGCENPTDKIETCVTLTNLVNRLRSTQKKPESET